MTKNKKVILFVHGLGGAADTWRTFEELVKNDSDLDWDMAHFEYPTPKLGIRLLPIFQSTYQPIQILADALRTAIDEQLQEYDEIALVGHSLGGLIIRKYLLTEVSARRKLRVQKVVLYAVPNDGSSLAAISRELSIWSNGHVKQLCKRSEFVENLRMDWARSDIDAEVDITVVVGGNDRIVSRISAEGNFRTRDREPKFILKAGHRDIVQPTGIDDLRYVILKNALKKKDR
jgi:pimeloyl-ACP methyl ester carboxylesterase